MFRCQIALINLLGITLNDTHDKTINRVLEFYKNNNNFMIDFYITQYFNQSVQGITFTTTKTIPHMKIIIIAQIKAIK